MVSPTIKCSEGPAHQVSAFIKVGMLSLNGQVPTQRSSPGYTTYMCKLIWAVRLQQRARPQWTIPPHINKQTNKLVELSADWLIDIGRISDNLSEF